jgi:hypothetical protein
MPPMPTQPDGDGLRFFASALGAAAGLVEIEPPNDGPIA